MPGPAPDPNALRRDRPSDAAGWTSLPAVYSGTTPDWPLSAGSDAESELWASLWRKPQAAMWARLDLRYQVAAYVRAFVASTSGDDPSSAMKTAVLRMEDGLGISAKGMNTLRWKIAPDEVGERRQAQAPTAVPRASARERAKKLAGA